MLDINFAKLTTTDDVMNAARIIAEKYDLANEDIYEELDTYITEKTSDIVASHLLYAAETSNDEDFQMNCVWTLDSLQRHYGIISDDVISMRADHLITKEVLDNVMTDGNLIDDIVMDFIMELIGHGDKDAIDVHIVVPKTLSIRYDYEEEPIEVTYNEILEKATNCLLRVSISSQR